MRAVLLACLLVLLTAVSGWAASATVSWSGVAASDLAGYKVYVGTASGSYTFPGSPFIVSSTTTSKVVTGLARGTTYYFAVTSYDTNGNESAKSTEIVRSVSMNVCSTSITNEPGHLTNAIDSSFDSTTENGWTVSGTAAIASDTGAPFTPNNVLRFTYPTGFTGGATPGSLTRNFGTNYAQTYIGTWWKPSNPWTADSSNTDQRIATLETTSGSLELHAQMYGTSSYSLALKLVANGLSLDNSHLPSSSGDTAGGTRILLPNVGSGTITPGNNHCIEVYAKASTTQSSQDGILRWYVGGAKVGEHLNANLPPEGFGVVRIKPQWGASTSTKPQQETVSYDHFRFSYATGSGGSPTSPPTISSFTASGTVGASITILGSNFDPVVGSNTVKINAVSASCSSATSVSLLCTVPVGATTGPLTVQTSAGLATSTTNFVVTVSSGGGGSTETAYSYSSGFSGVQGQNQWRYLKENGDPLTWDASRSVWDGGYPQATWNTGLSPATSSGNIVRWTAPDDGTARIIGVIRDYDPSCGGNGVTFTLKHNSTTLTSSTVAAGDTVGFSFDQTRSVTAGDTIDFLVTSNGDYSCDSSYLDPTITLTTAAPPTAPPPPPPSPPGTTPPPPAEVESGFLVNGYTLITWGNPNTTVATRSSAEIQWNTFLMPAGSWQTIRVTKPGVTSFTHTYTLFDADTRTSHPVCYRMRFFNSAGSSEYTAPKCKEVQILGSAIQLVAPSEATSLNIR